MLFIRILTIFDIYGDPQALDKIRFLALTDKEILGQGDNTKLEIMVGFKRILLCRIHFLLQRFYKYVLILTCISD